MEDNFDDFLDQVDPVNDVQDFDSDDEINPAGTGFVKEDEIKSVNRFRSMEDSPPSLSSLCILRISSWMNELTCDSASDGEKDLMRNMLRSFQSNSDHVHTFHHSRITLLPEDVQTKILSQLSLTTLKCIYREKVWDLDPLILAAGIKQEEDMLRYLFWKDPTHPLLRHFEKSLVINLFADGTPTLLNNKHLPPTDHVESALIQAYIKNCFNYEFCDREEFMKEFQKTTNNCFQQLNWNNVLVVGGSVLKSLRHKIKQDNRNEYSASDIDIYIYGLSTAQATAKVEEIYNAVKRVWKQSPIGIFKTANTITLAGDHTFRNIQIILSTYASPLEILLASDMNSCSIGFNGSSVLTIPRFLFGSMYGSNVLDSSTKFGTKLRWERLSKYYYRDYNIVSPLHLRVHGHGSFNTEETMGKNIHPSTRQMIELMCLNKMKILRISFGREKFGVDRESEFASWPRRWTRGIAIMKRSFMEYSGDEFRQLSQILPTVPGWIKNYYRRAQNLTLPANSIREAPRYSENPKTIDYLNWGDQSRNFNPQTAKIHAYVQEHCKFDEYNESSLQCFHLNFFVDKEQKASNPYKEMNTSLATLNYGVQSIQLQIKDFDKLLSGEVKAISVPVKLLNRNWTLSFTWGSNAISFMSFTKEADDKDEAVYNNAQSHPTKFFANFLIRVKTLKEFKLREAWRQLPKDITFDGSQVFTYNQPSNTWLTWIRNDYFRGQLNNAAEEWLQHVLQEEGLNARPKYVDDEGTAHWEVTLQLIEPQLVVTNL